jgi:hypothetical protein
VVAFSKGVINWVEDVFLDPYKSFYNWVAGATNVLDMEWRYVAMSFQRATPVGTVEDRAMVGLNLTNITSGDLDKSWTTQDYTDCDTILTEFWTGLKPAITNGHTLVDLRYYKKTFNSAVPKNTPADAIDPATGKHYLRFNKLGPPEHIFAINQTGGTSAAPMAYQVAASITLKTPTPKHWGRIYVPGLTSNASTTNGRWTPSTCTLLANQMAELIDDLHQKSFQLVVPTTQVNNVIHYALQTVSQVVVDDIPDVQRRRRPKQAALRTVGAPLP